MSVRNEVAVTTQTLRGRRRREGEVELVMSILVEENK
jgi:hypothetical protein